MFQHLLSDRFEKVKNHSLSILGAFFERVNIECISTTNLKDLILELF